MKNTRFMHLMDLLRRMEEKEWWCDVVCVEYLYTIRLMVVLLTSFLRMVSTLLVL